jgi:hypothetical protein
MDNKGRGQKRLHHNRVKIWNLRAVKIPKPRCLPDPRKLLTPQLVTLAQQQSEFCSMVNLMAGVTLKLLTNWLLVLVAP